MERSAFTFQVFSCALAAMALAACSKSEDAPGGPAPAEVDSRPAPPGADSTRNLTPADFVRVAEEAAKKTQRESFERGGYRQGETAVDPEDVID